MTTPRASSSEATPHAHDNAKAPSFTPAEAKQARRLFYVLILVSCFFVLELSGAMVARSNVLKADAIHLLMDILALAMSLIAMRIAVRRPTPRFTFGLRRAEPVAAIFNAILVLGATVEIVREGLAQLEGGQTPEAGLMLLVSVGALIVNGASAWLLHDAIGHSHAGHSHGGHSHAGHTHGGRGHSHADHSHESSADDGAPRATAGGHALNLRGARLHIIGDVLGSLAALAAAVAIHFGGSPAIDPVASFAVAVILLVGALRLLRDAMLVLLEASPPHLDLGAIRALALAVDGVDAIHALHAWSLGAGHDAITLHVISAAPTPQLALQVSDKLKRALSVEYVTVQVEPSAAAGRPSHDDDHDHHHGHTH